MAAVHGKKSVFKLGTHATPAVAVDISQYVDNVGIPRSHDMAESSGIGGQPAKTYVPGLRDATVPISGRYDRNTDEVLNSLDRNEDLVTFEYHPEGTAAGTIFYTGQGFIQAYELTSPVGDVVGFTCTLQVSGDVTRENN